MKEMSKGEKMLRTKTINRLNENIPIIERDISTYKSNFTIRTFGPLRITTSTKNDEQKNALMVKIAKFERDVMTLQSVDSANEKISYYERKINTWRRELLELEMDLRYGNKKDNTNKENIKMQDECPSITNTVNQSSTIKNNQKEQNNQEKTKEKFFLNEEDVGSVKATIAKLSIDIDTKIGESEDISQEKAQFDYALMILKTKLPNDTVIAYYEQKRLEWNLKEKENRKKQIVIGIVIFFIFIISILLSEYYK